MEEMLDRNSLASTIAGNVRRLRTDRGWSQAELADRLQIHRVSLARIETGNALPDSNVLFALADTFGVSADSLRQVSAAVA